MNGINDYTGNSTPGGVEAGGKRYVTVYNNSGSAISNGAIKALSTMWITGVGVVLVPVAVATNAIKSTQIGICEHDGGSLANGAYGQFLVKGPYGSLAAGYGVTTSGSVAANAQLEVLNATTAFIDSGNVGGGLWLAESVALAIELVATNTWAVYLNGDKNVIAAS